MRPPASRLALPALAIVAVALAAGACSSSSSAPPAAPVSLDQFAAEVGAAVCDHIGPCCAGAGLGYDAATCKSNLAASLGQELSDPKMKYDPVAGGNCVQAAKAAAATCFASPLAFYQACGSAFVGTVAIGGACSSSQECASGANGAVVECNGSGTCAAKVHGKAGDPCDSTCTSAASGSSCWSFSTSGSSPPANAVSCWTNDGLTCGPTFTCQAIPQTGQACTYGSCVTGDYCGSDGKCAPKVAIGAVCASPDACVTGAYCAMTTPPGTCTALKPDGATCASFAECQSGRCDSTSNTCKTDAAVDAQMCGASTPAADAGTSG